MCITGAGSVYAIFVYVSMCISTQYLNRIPNIGVCNLHCFQVFSLGDNTWTSLQSVEQAHSANIMVLWSNSFHFLSTQFCCLVHTFRPKRLPNWNWMQPNGKRFIESIMCIFLFIAFWYRVVIETRIMMIRKTLMWKFPIWMFLCKTVLIISIHIYAHNYLLLWDICSYNCNPIPSDLDVSV